jgi:hypothetical protein
VNLSARTEFRGQLWTSRPLPYLSSLQHPRFLLHCVNSLTSDAEFKLTRDGLPAPAPRVAALRPGGPWGT